MIDELFRRNKQWAGARRVERADYFERLSNLQRPEYLWIGCSDSRVPANVIAGLEPGEVFVHRNVANLIHPTDLNMLSAVEYAVRQLRVRHIIVCGHYGCGGISAAVGGTSLSLVDHWLQPIRDLATATGASSPAREWSERELDTLCEGSVVSQVQRLARTPILQAAWQSGQQISIHGWVYGLKDGILRDLECTTSGIPA